MGAYNPLTSSKASLPKTWIRRYGPVQDVMVNTLSKERFLMVLGDHGLKHCQPLYQQFLLMYLS